MPRLPSLSILIFSAVGAVLQEYCQVVGWPPNDNNPNNAEVIANYNNPYFDSEFAGASTSIAAMIGAYGYGPAFDASLISVKVYDSRFNRRGAATPNWQITMGIDWVIEKRLENTSRPAVMSVHSFGRSAHYVSDHNGAMRQSINRALENGIVVIGSGPDFLANACSFVQSGIRGSLFAGVANKEDVIPDYLGFWNFAWRPNDNSNSTANPFFGSAFGKCVDMWSPGVIDTAPLGSQWMCKLNTSGWAVECDGLTEQNYTTAVQTNTNCWKKGSDFTVANGWGPGISAAPTAGVAALFLEEFPCATAYEAIDGIIASATLDKLSFANPDAPHSNFKARFRIRLLLWRFRALGDVFARQATGNRLLHSFFNNPAHAYPNCPKRSARK
eukprot:tig00000786_g4056.t1